jgi:tetratricopeptide (TPR) repeat protein
MPEERKSTPEEQKHRQGAMLFNQGSYDQAARLFAEALDIQETSDRWNDWATAQMLCEHRVSAERGFVYALELNPQNQQAAANLGTFLVRSGKFVEALPLLERAMNGTGGQPDSVVATLLAHCRARLASGKAITGLKHPAKPVQKVLDSVFIHIPKTAGVSLRSRLERSLPLYSVSPHVHPSAMTEEEAGPLRAYAVVSGHISWIDAQRFFPDRKKFTFLRDPVDRCVSLYFYFRSMPLERPIPLERITYQVIPEEAHSLARILDIEDFFQSRHPIIRGHLCNLCVWQLGDRVRPKTRSISESEILAQALKNVEKIDFIGLYERLEEDSSRLCRFLGIRESVSLRHENKSENRPSLSDLSPKALELVKRLTDLDRRLYESVVNKILRHS